jgi:gas vesicle protein
MDYARQRIIQDLKVTKPQVYGLSAVTMLPIKQVPIGKESDWPVFRRAFVDFMTLTWVRLQNSKEYVLSEHVNILVKDVALSCAEKLRLKQKELQKDKSFLQSHRIETIQAVCEIMVKNSLNAINEVISSVHYSFSTAESSSRSDAKSIIESGIMNPDRFNNVMIPQIRSSVESAAGNVLQDLNASINGKVKKRVKEELSKMSDVFESHYSQFQSLKPKETAPTVDLIKFNNPMLNFNIALNKIKELDSEENEAAGGGALAGASIGFLVGGPVGAFFGALGGAVFGLGAGDQSDSMRASAIPLVQNEISAFFSSLRIKVADEISSIKSKYVNLINQYAKDHVSKYGNSVQKLIKKHEDRIREKDSKISSLKVAIRNLQNIQDDVEHELLILKIK